MPLREEGSCRARAGCRVHHLDMNDITFTESLIKNVDQLNSIDGDMYPPNQPKLNFAQLGLTH